MKRTIKSVAPIYILLILVNSLTPLAIVVSSEAIDPRYSVFLRIVLAAVLGLLIIKIFRMGSIFPSGSFRVYCYSLIGMYLGLSLTYLSSQYIPSGLIALIFGLSPIVSGLIASCFHGNPGLEKSKWFASIGALIGLFVILSEEIYIGSTAPVGCLLALGAVFLTCFSSHLIKESEHSLSPMVLTVGSMLLSLPLFFISALVFGEITPIAEIDTTTKLTIVYLAIVGSLLGFYCFFFILEKVSVNSLMVMNLIVPAFSLVIGCYLNNEILSISDLVGISLIFFSLTIYFWWDKYKFSLVRYLGQPMDN